MAEAGAAALSLSLSPCPLGRKRGGPRFGKPTHPSSRSFSPALSASTWMPVQAATMAAMSSGPTSGSDEPSALGPASSAR